MFGRQGWVDLKAANDLKNGYKFNKKVSNIPNNKHIKISAEAGEKKHEIVNSGTNKGKHNNICKNKGKKITTSAKIFGFACMLFLPIALVLTIIGMATPYWLKTNTGSLGLFQICKSDTTVCEDVTSFLSTSSSTTSFTWYLVIGLIAAGCFLLLIAVILVICVYPSCEERSHKTLLFGVVISIIILLGAAAIIAGTSCMFSYYTQQAQYVLDWSFYLSACGGVIAFLAFCLFLTHICLVAFQ